MCVYVTFQLYCILCICVRVAGSNGVINRISTIIFSSNCTKWICG